METVACVHCGMNVEMPSKGEAKPVVCPRCGKPVVPQTMVITGSSATTPPTKPPQTRPAASDARTVGGAPKTRPAASNARTVGNAQQKPSADPTLVAGVSPSKAAAHQAKPVQTVGSLGHYVILDEIARGGMGVVYRAKDTRLDRIVAVKVLIGGEIASQEQIDRFTREAQAAAKLRHPNIVSIFDVGLDKGRHYFAMEYVVGQPLSRLVQSKTLAQDKKIDIMIQVCEAIAAAHRMGIIHRDIKPANILVDTDSRARVTDFGLAKAVKSEEGLTKSGTTMGTPGYMPPEQARGDSKDVDERSDIYSIGAVLYELITGQPPFSGGTDIDTILKVISEEPANPRKLNPGISKDLETICLKAMEKDKTRRYQSAQELIDDLRRFQAGDPITARPISTVHRIRMKMAKHKAITAVVATAVITLLVVSGLFIAGLAKKQKELEKEKQKKPEIVTVTNPGLPKTRWQELLSANFDDGKPGNWKSAGKNWTVKDGRLVGKAAGELNDNELTSEADIHGNFEAEFDILPDEKNPGVFSFFFLRNADRTTGYELQIALSQNGIFLLQKSIRENLGKAAVLLGPGPHRLKLCKTVNELRLWIDGAEPLTMLAFDPSPITDPANIQFGFTVTKGTASLDNVVMRGDSPEYRTSLLAAADKVLQGGFGKYAIEMYNEFIGASTDEDLKAEAKYKLALCIANAPEKEQDPAKIEAAFKRVVKDHPGTFFAKEAERRISIGSDGLASAATSDPAAMLEAFGQAAAMLQSGGVEIEMSESPDAEEEIDIRIAAAQNESSKLSLMFQKGYILLAQCKYKEAIACFDKVVQDTGSDRESRSIQGGALLSLAYCHYQLEDFAAAEKCYRKMADRLKDLIEKFKKDGLKLLLRTMNMKKEEDEIAKGQGTWEEKAKKIEENRREMAGPFEALTQAAAAKSGLAMTLANLGKFEEALKEADGLTLEAFIPEIGKMQESPIKIALGSAQGDSISILKANILLRAGRFEEAVKEAQRVLPRPIQVGKKRDMHDGDYVLKAYDIVFLIQAITGKFEDARKLCDRTIANQTMRPWAPLFEIRLAYIDIFTGKPEEARKRLEELASRDPKDVGQSTLVKAKFLVSGDDAPDPKNFSSTSPEITRAWCQACAGLRFELNGKTKEAIESYKKSMEAAIGTDDPYTFAASRTKALEKRK